MTSSPGCSRLQPRHQLEAVELRHPDVEDGEVGLNRRQWPGCRVDDAADHVVDAAEHALDRAQHAGLVVDDEDARGPLHGCRVRAWWNERRQGTVTCDVGCPPGSLSTLIVPPTSHTIERQIDRPSPLPLAWS